MVTKKPLFREGDDPTRDAQMDWIRSILDARRTNASRLAAESGVSDSTLTRWMRGETKHLSGPVLQQISEFSGIPAPGARISKEAAQRGVREEGTPYRAEGELVSYKDAVATLLRDRPNAHAWTIKSDVMALAGVRSGDVVIVDRSLEPKDGDIVCAQIEIGLGAMTVFRLYQKPNLVGAAFDPTAVRPELVDGARVRIAGVMTDLLRQRR